MSSVLSLPPLSIDDKITSSWLPTNPEILFRPRIASHEEITKSPHDLKYNAAAFSQLVWDGTNHSQDLLGHLIASPYNDRLHLLDLETLDEANQLLAIALTLLTPTRNDYATAPYQDSFNWTAVVEFMKHLAEAQQHRWTCRTFYVVVFRSKRSRTDRNIDIGELDAHAHQEAISSGGLLKYWFGDIDEDGHNLATCIWRSRDDAKRGGAGPGHARAMRAARTLYEHFDFSRLALRIEDNFMSWHISAWTE